MIVFRLILNISLIAMELLTTWYTIHGIRQFLWIEHPRRMKRLARILWLWSAILIVLLVIGFNLSIFGMATRNYISSVFFTPLMGKLLFEIFVLAGGITLLVKRIAAKRGRNNLLI